MASVSLRRPGVSSAWLGRAPEEREDGTAGSLSVRCSGLGRERGFLTSVTPGEHSKDVSEAQGPVLVRQGVPPGVQTCWGRWRFAVSSLFGQDRLRGSGVLTLPGHPSSCAALETLSSGKSVSTSTGSSGKSGMPVWKVRPKRSATWPPAPPSTPLRPFKGVSPAPLEDPFLCLWQLSHVRRLHHDLVDPQLSPAAQVWGRCVPAQGCLCHIGEHSSGQGSRLLCCCVADHRVHVLRCLLEVNHLFHAEDTVLGTLATAAERAWSGAGLFDPLVAPVLGPGTLRSST